MLALLRQLAQAFHRPVPAPVRAQDFSYRVSDRCHVREELHPDGTLTKVCSCGWWHVYRLRTGR